jgi:hypothetical protein
MASEPSSRERAITAYADWKFPKKLIGHMAAEFEASAVLDMAQSHGLIVWADEHERRLATVIEIARDAVAYIDTFRHTRPDRGEVAAEFRRRLDAVLGDTPSQGADHA